MKYKELITQSADQLRKQLSELRQKLSELTGKLKLGQLKNVHELHVVKKDIAKILTALHNM